MRGPMDDHRARADRPRCEMCDDYGLLDGLERCPDCCSPSSCAECGHRSEGHGLGSIHDGEERCRFDNCTCLLSSREASWGRDEAMDDSIAAAQWEEAVANGEPWALESRSADR